MHQDIHTEILNTETPRDAERALAVARLLSDANRHFMLPRAIEEMAMHHELHIRTAHEDDEVSIAAVHIHFNVLEVVHLIDNLITLLTIFSILGIKHGAICEASIFFSASKRAFVLRGFSSCGADGMDDARAVANMIARLSLHHWFRADEVQAALLRSDIQTAQTVINVIKMVYASASNQSLQRQRVEMANYMKNRARIYAVKVDCRDFATTGMNDIVFQVNALINASMASPAPLTHSLQPQVGGAGAGAAGAGEDAAIAKVALPMFEMRNSPAQGDGPEIQIINSFFHQLRRARVIDAMDDGYLWPVERFDGTRETLRVLGFMIVYCACLGVRMDNDVRFAPALLRMILSESADVHAMAYGLKAHKELIVPRLFAISQMMAGAVGMARFLRTLNWPVELLYSDASAPQASGAGLNALAFTRDVSDDERRAFIDWFTDEGAEGREAFMRWATGATGRARVTIDVNRMNDYSHVSVCNRWVTLPAVVLSSAGSVKKFMKEDVTSAFNCV